MVPQEPIFKGATRPAMKFGVPLVGLVVVGGLGAVAILWGGILISWWVAAGVVAAIVPIWAWMRWVTHHDDQRFRHIALDARLRVRDRNRRVWRCRSYRPCAPREAGDVRIS